jgi:hypothetical protein
MAARAEKPRTGPCASVSGRGLPCQLPPLLWAIRAGSRACGDPCGWHVGLDVAVGLYAAKQADEVEGCEELRFVGPAEAARLWLECQAGKLEGMPAWHGCATLAHGAHGTAAKLPAWK